MASRVIIADSGESIVLENYKIVSLIAWNKAEGQPARIVEPWSFEATCEGKCIYKGEAFATAQISLRKCPISLCGRALIVHFSCANVALIIERSV